MSARIHPKAQRRDFMTAQEYRKKEKLSINKVEFEFAVQEHQRRAVCSQTFTFFQVSFQMDHAKSA